MEIIIEIPKYDPDKGIRYQWTDGFEIQVVIDRGKVLIIANNEGLTSLANHLLNLAQDEIPSGYDMHFDDYNSLEDGSVNLIIEKK